MNQTTPQQETPPLSVRPIPQKGIPGFPGIILIILLSLSALLIPLGVSALVGIGFMTLPVSEGISLLYLILLIFYFSRTAKLSGGTSRGITPLLVLTGLLSYALVGSLIPAVILSALVFVIGEGAVLLATADRLRGILFVLIPGAVFALSLLLCGILDMALCCLLPFPAAVALGLGTRSSANKETGLTRVGVICITSLVLGATLSALILWWVYRTHGTLALSLFSDMLEALREAMKELLLNYSISYGDTVVTPLAGKEAEVANVVNSTINTLPSTLVVTFNVIAAVAQMVSHSGLHAYGFGASVTSRVRDFHISAVSAAVFLLSWILALVAVGENNASTLVGTVAENFFIILTPGLALAGLFRYMRNMAKRGARMGCSFFLVILIPCLVLYVPTVAALYEACSLLFVPLVAKLKSKKSDDPSDEPPRPFKKSKDDKPLSDAELFERYCKEREEHRKGDDEQNKDDT